MNKNRQVKVLSLEPSSTNRSFNGVIQRGPSKPKQTPVFKPDDFPALRKQTKTDKSNDVSTPTEASD